MPNFLKPEFLLQEKKIWILKKEKKKKKSNIFELKIRFFFFFCKREIRKKYKKV